MTPIETPEHLTPSEIRDAAGLANWEIDAADLSADSPEFQAWHRTWLLVPEPRRLEALGFLAVEVA